MATTPIGQIISEFITRAEAYIAFEFLEIVKNQELGDEYETSLYKMESLYSFLIELQGLDNQWTEREIQQFVNYWDDKCKLKSLMGIIPDPYKSYDNPILILKQSTTLEVPSGEGILYKDNNGNISLIENATTIINNYGLE